MISEQMEQRIYQCLDGELSETEKNSLFQELNDNPEALRVYCSCAALDANLQGLAHGELNLNDATGNVAVLATSPQRKKTKLAGRSSIASKASVAAIAAAVIAILGLLSLLLWQAEDSSPLVSFDPSPGTQFTLTHDGAADPPEETCLQAGSQLKLSQGTVELIFQSGVRSIITAPADLTLHNGNTLILNTGAAWFQVPESAVGFTVRTKELKVVDLGTEFGVIAKLGGHDEVHVFKGEVEASTPGAQKKSTKLVAGEARRSDSTDGLAVIKPRSKSFLTKSPTTLAAYRGPLNIVKGAQVTAKGGVGYTLSASPEVTTDKLEDGEFMIKSGGSLSLVFAKPVDLQISAANIPYGEGRPWNSVEDFGRFSIIGGELSKLDDPNQELMIEPLSETSFKWKFTKSNDDKYRTPSLQTYRVELKGIRELQLSKEVSSQGRAAFKFQVTSPSRR